MIRKTATWSGFPSLIGVTELKLLLDLAFNADTAVEPPKDLLTLRPDLMQH